MFGKQAKFHCDGVADSDYIISWYHGGKKIKKNAKYSFSDKQRTLVINNVNEEDVGKYKCTMKGTYGEQSVTAALTSASSEYPLCLFVCVLLFTLSILEYSLVVYLQTATSTPPSYQHVISFPNSGCF